MATLRLLSTSHTILCTRGLLLICGILLSVTAARGDENRAAYKPEKRIVVIAHRGAHDTAPENTLAAFRRAIELGCDWVELDVHETRDGQIVIMHDRSVERTTNGHGLISQMTLAEIRSLDIVSKNHPTWIGHKVPTLGESLDECRGKIKVYIDYKDGDPQKILNIVSEHQMLSEVLVYGSAKKIRPFRKLNPNVMIMLDRPKSSEELAALLTEMKPETLDNRITDWTAEDVALAHRYGARVWPNVLWQNDNEVGYRKAIEMGVDGLETDNPEMVIAFLKKIDRR